MIRGFRDLSPDNNYQSVQDSNVFQQINKHKIPFVYNPPNDIAPLDQTIPSTLRLTFCPALKIISFTNILVLTITIIYIVCCFMGLQPHGTSVLTIQSNFLLKLGANNPTLVQQGSVYRLITAAFLHGNFAHLLSNVIASYILISRLQACYNVLYVISIFLVSAISGNLLSDLCANNMSQISVGTSTALYGFIATFVGYMVINWSALAGLGSIRSQMACTIGFLVFFSIIVSFIPSGNAIDYYGHLGGFIGGFFFCLLILPPIDPSGPKTVKIVGGVILFVYFLVITLVFYLAK